MQYAEQLQPLARELASVIEELHYKHKALPLFDPASGYDELNWKMDPNFKYTLLRKEGGLQKLKEIVASSQSKKRQQEKGNASKGQRKAMKKNKEKIWSQSAEL